MFCECIFFWYRPRHLHWIAVGMAKSNRKRTLLSCLLQFLNELISIFLWIDLFFQTASFADMIFWGSRDEYTNPNIALYHTDRNSDAPPYHASRQDGAAWQRSATAFGTIDSSVLNQELNSITWWHTVRAGRVPHHITPCTFPQTHPHVTPATTSTETDKPDFTAHGIPMEFLQCVICLVCAVRASVWTTLVFYGLVPSSISAYQQDQPQLLRLFNCAYVSCLSNP